ncbi:MAG: DUF4386 domain-containing protein [Acidimicrobiales bacterium]
MTYSSAPVRKAGWLFVVATATGVASVIAMAGTLGDDDLLVAVHDHQASLLAGELLVFMMLAAMIGTAVFLWPVLRRHSETLALGYVLARTLEVVTIAVGLIGGLLLVPLSWNAMADGAPPTAEADLLAETLKASSDWTGLLGAQMVFSLSALVLNWVLYRYRLVPRWLSVWGLVGVPAMFLSGALVMIETLNSSASALNLLVAPLAVQEMVMAVWMIVKGFDEADDVASSLDLTTDLERVANERDRVAADAHR